jgi:hypothetical protein
MDAANGLGGMPEEQPQAFGRWRRGLGNDDGQWRSNEAQTGQVSRANYLSFLPFNFERVRLD